MKKKSLRTLKAKAWKTFSEWIRRKDADEGGTTRCYTCGVAIYWKDCDAGHFVPGRTNAVLFHEEIVKPQCKICNIWKRGNYQAYTLKMVDEYGRDRVEEFLALKSKIVKLTRSDLEDIIQTYKQKLQTLEA